MLKTKIKTKINTNLNYTNKNGYEKISPQELKKIEEICSLYIKFLGSVKTEREAHDISVQMLEDSGFREFEYFERNKLKLKTGAKVYKSCTGKSLMALVLGKQPIEKGMQIIGAHIDAPRIDVKQNPLYENGDLVLIDTHYYGGIKKYQWLTIPLALHGVFVKPSGEKIKVTIGENPDEPVFCITDLLPHLAQDQMKKNLSEAIEGENLDVVAGSIPTKDKKVKEKIKQNILKILNEKYQITEEDFFSAELEFVPSLKPREVGFDKSMIIGYGQDDRVCAYTALKALIDMTNTPEFTCCIILADKEEIGSFGATGMASNFFENTLGEVINLIYNSFNELTLKRAMNNSWMISADVNSLFDPLYPNVSEKKNTAIINHGVCLTKYTGEKGKARASDANAEFVAQIRRIFDKNKVIWQTGELGKVDQGGGGTIAYLMARYGMQVIDCGVGLLSMHSPMELSGKLDIYMAYKGYLAFFKDSRK